MSRRIRSRIVVLLSLAGWSLNTFGQAQDRLLDEVRIGNRATVESIRTLHCQITRSTVRVDRSSHDSTSCEYWSSPAASRVRPLHDVRFQDSVVRDSTATSLHEALDKTGRKFIRASIQKLAPHQPHSEFDPWGAGLLKLPCGPNSWPLLLDDLLKRPHRLESVERAPDENRESIVVSISVEVAPDTPGQFIISFDPQLNYLAYKLVGKFPQSPTTKAEVRRETTVLSFREVNRAIHFPEHAETKFYEGGKLVNHVDFRFEEIRINEPLTKETFELAIPANAEVFDSIQNRHYKLDGDGNVVGEVDTVSGPPMPPGEAPVAMTASTAEPSPATWWILPGSIAVLLVGLGLLIYRGWRTR